MVEEGHASLGKVVNRDPGMPRLQLGGTVNRTKIQFFRNLLNGPIRKL